MRIGIASWEYPPKHTGGLGRHVEGLSKSLARAGHEVFIFIPERNYPGLVEGINFVSINSRKKGFTWIREVNEEIVGQALKIGLDVFHAQDWITFPSAIELKSYNKFPVVCSVHSTEHDRAGMIVREKTYSLELEERGLKACDRVITVSNYMKNQLINLFSVPEGKISVIPNGIVPDSFSAGGNGKDVLFMGRLTEQKGVEYLLYALKDYGFDGRIVVLGDGHLKNSLENFSKNLGLSNVVFPGFVRDDEVIRDYLSCAGVMVMPSMREPFGIVALEAACAGVPLVLSRTAGVSEFFTHGKDALLVDPTNPAELVEAVRRLDDDAFRDKLVSNARELVNSDVFNWDRIAEKTVSIYSGLIK